MLKFTYKQLGGTGDMNIKITKTLDCRTLSKVVYLFLFLKAKNVT